MNNFESEIKTNWELHLWLHLSEKYYLFLSKHVSILKIVVFLQACSFPTDQSLTYLSQFSKQDNCLLECKLKKIAQICGCAPWYLNQVNTQIFY
jgi:hypothetical protein